MIKISKTSNVFLQLRLIIQVALEGPAIKLFNFALHERLRRMIMT